MAGVQSATLMGWAIPTVAPPWDHTYVTSDCGLSWGCFGRSSGGQALLGATGSSIVADCLAQPNGLAGIIYLITGVCHQISNRILYPAGVTVAGCNGYALSAFTFGPHGRGQWVELPGCISPGSLVAWSGGAPKNQNGVTMSGKNAYDQTVSRAPGENRLSELAALIQLGLGHPLDPPTFNALAFIQIELWDTQQILAAAFLAKRISHDVYLEKLATIVQSTLHKCTDLLGETQFTAIFGAAGWNPEGLMDRSTFLTHHPSDLHSP